MAIFCGIYIIECIPTGERYVGSSEDIDRRWSTHRSQLKRGVHHSRSMQSRWDEFGAAAFKFEILELVLCDNLLVAERSLILSGSFVFNGIFPRLNPMKGKKHSPESIALMRKNRAGIPGPIKKGDRRSKEFGLAVSRAKKGKPRKAQKLTSEQIARATARIQAFRGSFSGRRHSDAAREKMKAAAIARDRCVYRRGVEHPKFGKPAWNRGVSAPKGGGATAAKSIEVNGIAYGCAAEAAKGLGVSLRSFYNYRDRGTIDVKPIERSKRNIV